MLLNIGERRRFVYRIAVLTDLKHEGEHYAKVINDYCINQKLFPLLETYQNQEVFFKEIQTHVPDIVLLVLPGVDSWLWNYLVQQFRFFTSCFQASCRILFSGTSEGR